MRLRKKESCGNSAGVRFSRRWAAVWMLALSFAIAAGGCGGGGDDGGSTTGGTPDGPPSVSDRQMRLDFLGSVGNGFIVPTYAEMETESAELARRAAVLCNQPSPTSLQDAQEQWRRVMGLWLESELVNFVPGINQFRHTAIISRIDVPWRVAHADVEAIEQRIAGIEPIGAEQASSWRTQEIGLKGIEYLLFGGMDTGGTILAGYDRAETAGVRRCDYLHAVAVHLNDNVKAIHDIWRPGGDNFVGDWNSPGDGNPSYRFVQDAVDELINRMQFALEDLVHSRLGGHSSLKRETRQWVEGRPESWRSGNSIANIRHRLEAAEMIYLGIDRVADHDGFGIDEYLQRTGEANLASRIRSQFDASFDAVGDIPETLREAVEDQQSLGTVNEAERVTRDLLVLIKRDMGEHLGVFFGFNDADGD